MYLPLRFILWNIFLGQTYYFVYKVMYPPFTIRVSFFLALSSSFLYRLPLSWACLAGSLCSGYCCAVGIEISAQSAVRQRSPHSVVFTLNYIRWCAGWESCLTDTIFPIFRFIFFGIVAAIRIGTHYVSPWLRIHITSDLFLQFFFTWYSTRFSS